MFVRKSTVSAVGVVAASTGLKLLLLFWLCVGEQCVTKILGIVYVYQNS